tara:strand:+ start:231 stop:980 length:750 start_codon:yes stop_codon:yes gene_type:complete
MTSFEESLSIGKISEKLVLEKIQKKYPNAEMTIGKNSDYDIYIPEISIGVEVKQDASSHFWGNILVEIECNGKPSGISNTKADWWVFDDGVGYYWYKIDELVKLVKNRPVSTIQPDGDPYSKKVHKVKREIIIGNADYIEDTINKEENQGVQMKILNMTKGSWGKTRAMFNLAIDIEGLKGGIIIGGFSLVEGTDGLFLSYPSKQKKDGSWDRIARTGDKQGHFDLQKLAMEEYQGVSGAETSNPDVPF